MIQAQNVSICYKMPGDRAGTFKEYALRRLCGGERREPFWALRDVTFTSRRGEVLGIVGPNGAGKSTLLKTVAGILKPTGGSITVSGTVAPMLELGSGFDYDLTGRENIFLNGAILGYSRAFLREKYARIVDFSGLGKFIDAPLRSYSSGMVMRLAFSVAAAGQPDVLIVDEILSVGDGVFRDRSAARMRELMRGGAAVLFVSHSLDQVEDLCDKALWLEGGQAKMLGDARSVCAAYRAGTAS